MGTESFSSKPEKTDQEHISQEDFERQFSEVHVTEGQDPVSYTSVEPENPTSDNWVVYIGGFGQGKDSYLDEIKDLAMSGRKILFTNPTRGIENENLKKDELLNNVPDTIIAKTEAVQKILDTVSARKVDFVGHSQGAAVATAYAAIHPGVAQRIVLECPAGVMGGRDSREKIIGRFVGDKISTLTNDSSKLLDESGKRATSSFVRETFGNVRDIPFRLTQEIPGVATVDIMPLLKKIKKRDDDTEVILINANSDKVYSPKSIEEAFGEKPLEDSIDRWVMYGDKNASHNAPTVERAGLLRQVLQ